jgi:DNA invertase Pin-like site-specific DNA recombinase
MFQMLGVFAEFERSMIQERVRSGLAKAKANGTKSGKAIERPAIPEAKRQRIRDAHATGDVSLRKLAKQFNVSPATVLSIVHK